MHFQVWDIRNLFFPEFLIAPALRIANILGVSDTKSLLWSATFPIVLLASINVILVFQIAETLNADPLAAAFASLLYAFHWLPLGFGSTVYPRTASTCCILLISFKRRWNHAWGKSFFAGVLLSIAFAIRYSEIVFLFPLLIFAYLRNDHDRIPATAILIAGFCIGTVFSVGLEDSLTWGKWFSSLIAFAKFTLLQKESSSLSGHQPWYYYALRLPEWLSPFLLPFFWMYKKQKNELGIGYFILLPLCSISLIFHKELRYLQGIIPFVCLVSGIGAAGMYRTGFRKLTFVLLILAVLTDLWDIRFVSKKSMSAIEAARFIAANPMPVVALSQPWAYGEHLYLGNQIRIVELPMPPRANDISQLPKAVFYVGIYERDLKADAGLISALRDRGFVEVHGWQISRSKPVVLFRRK